MKTLSAGLQAYLDSGATTLCWCWRVTRNDAVALGLTDHGVRRSEAQISAMLNRAVARGNRNL